MTEIGSVVVKMLKTTATIHKYFDTSVRTVTSQCVYKII
jgi:hypothetical protein